MIADDRLVFLGIETTCDETGAAVLEGPRPPARGVPVIRSSVVASQIDLHERFGGVVPEIASRAHVRQVLPVIDEALRRAGVGLADLGAVAVATRPGLVGALVVGLTAAKALALALDVPLIAVDHLEGHLYACQLAYPDRDVYPCLGLVVSGGHTSLYHCRGPVDAEVLGGTTDDAAGEAFDKVASLLGLGYPGGPEIQRVAQLGNPQAFAFPRSYLRDERLIFSFSGIKTAVLYALKGQDARGSRGPPPPALVAEVAASFQEAVVDVLVAKTRQALAQTGLKRLGIGGGVAANGRFRERIAAMADSEGRRAVHPAAVALHRQRGDGGHCTREARGRPGRRPRHRRDRRPGPAGADGASGQVEGADGRGGAGIRSPGTRCCSSSAWRRRSLRRVGDRRERKGRPVGRRGRWSCMVETSGRSRSRRTGNLCSGRTVSTIAHGESSRPGRRFPLIIIVKSGPMFTENRSGRGRGGF